MAFSGDAVAAEQENTITLHIHELRPDVSAQRSLAQIRLSDYFFDRLVQLIAQHFRLHGKAGPDDVANSVLRIAFQGIEEGRYQEFHCREDLWALLVTIAGHKAQNRIRDENRQRRSPGTVISAEGLETAKDSSADPVQSAMLREQCQRLIDLLPPDKPELRRIVHWKVDEHLSNREIAERLDCSEEKVRRQVLYIRSLWKRELRDG